MPKTIQKADRRLPNLLPIVAERSHDVRVVRDGHEYLPTWVLGTLSPPGDVGGMMSIDSVLP